MANEHAKSMWKRGYERNRDYHLKYQAKKRQNPEYQLSLREKQLKKAYGIGVAEYQHLFSKQNGCCAICSAHQSVLKRRLHVDHNHTTGKVRALLCSACNTAVGMCKENVETLNKMISYLKEHE